MIDELNKFLTLIFLRFLSTKLSSIVSYSDKYPADLNIRPGAYLSSLESEISEIPLWLD